METSPHRFQVGQAIMAGIWLVFLGYPVLALFQRGLPPVQIALGLVLLTAFCVVYLAGFGWSSSLTPALRWSWVGAMAVLVLAQVPLIGPMIASYSTYFVATLVFVFPWRLALVLSPLIVLVSSGTMLVMYRGEEWIWYVGASLWLGPAIVSVVAVMDRREKRQVRWERRLDLSVQREHLARDVHDLLGHSLTVINLKAELAAKQLDEDPEAARHELTEISRLSRTALAEVRSTVTRLRVPDFAGEVQAARRALQTAGTVADLPEPEQAQRLAGGNAALYSWVLRESVTNVVRHAEAGRCRVLLSSEKLQVDDDGAGIPEGRAWGNGLSGLAARVREAGGTLRVGPSSGAAGPPSEGRRGTRVLLSMTGDLTPLSGSETEIRTRTQPAPKPEPEIQTEHQEMP